MPSITALLQILFWLGLVVFIVSTLALPIVLVQIPADYFVRPTRTARDVRPYGIKRVIVRTLRNTIAVVFLMAGIMMLFTPGQGILMILAALWVATFPGKDRLERQLVLLPGVLTIVNKIRVKAGATPLDSPESVDSSDSGR